jgi:hypothetical protein
VAPEFYGYVPDQGKDRIRILICMTLNGALMLLLRSLSITLLAVVKDMYFVLCVRVRASE